MRQIRGATMIGASLNVPCDCPFLKGLRDGSRWRAYYLVLKGHAFGIVFRKPGLRGVRIREDLEVIRSPTCLLVST